MSKIHFKFEIVGADGALNRNERVINVFLSESPPGAFPDSSIVSLFSFQPNPCGTTESPLIRCGTLTNIDVPSTIIAAIFGLCRKGLLKVVVYGVNGGCDENTLYGFLQGGLIAAQVWPARTQGP